jgi:hypothetical protein
MSTTEGEMHFIQVVNYAQGAATYNLASNFFSESPNA